MKRDNRLVLVSAVRHKDLLLNKEEVMMRRRTYARILPELFPLIILALCFPASFAIRAQRPSPQPPKPEIPLLGLDPVLLLQGKEVQGDLNISTIRGPYKYLFA